MAISVSVGYKHYKWCNKDYFDKNSKKYVTAASGGGFLAVVSEHP